MSLIGPDDLTILIRAAVIAVGDSDATDVMNMRDTLWLAAAIAAGETPDQEQPNDDRAEASVPGKPQVRSSAKRPESIRQSPAEVFDVSGQASEGLAGTDPARPVDLIGPAALRQRLELARALRPFRRAIPSHHRYVLDVEATVRSSAVSRRILPILRPAEERRFSADLVFDASPSMEVWDETFEQFARVFRHAGAFRDVRTWRLHTDQDRGGVWLTDRMRYRRPPAVLHSADRRRVILVMTDGVADHWYMPQVWECLADWGNSGPAALMDPLPVKLWSLSGIGPNRVRVRASSPGAPNADLRYKPRRLGRTGRSGGATVPVPVIEFSPSALMEWTATVADAHPAGCVAVLTGPEPRRAINSPWPGDTDAEASLSNLFHTASPTALRLAVLAALSETMDLAVLRAIQDEMLPDSSTSDLAEVLVSGIFRRVPNAGGSGLRIQMHAACRAQLQRHASVQDRWDVYRAISAAIARRYPGSASRFRAAVLDFSGNVRIPAEQLAFAAVARSTLAQARQVSQAPPIAVPAIPPTVRLFLSYAEADGEIARQVVGVLAERGMDVYGWQDSRRQSSRYLQEVQEQISRVDAFIALLSPSFLRSQQCGQEMEFALQHERDLRARGRESGFIHVLKVADTPQAAAGLLGSHDWLDLTSPASIDMGLHELVDRLQSASELASPSTDFVNRAIHDFRDRREELDRVRYGLSNPGGPHFWLVVAPPQLGKTRLLQQISTELAALDPERWVVKLVDVREHFDLCDNALLLLGRLFDGTAAQKTTASDVVRDIAVQIAAAPGRISFS